MRDHEIFRRFVWGLASGLLVVAPFASGCDLLRQELFQNCDDAKQSYEQALESEQTELKSSSELPDRNKRPAHFGLTLSNELLTDLANIAVEPILKSAVKLASTVEIQGQDVDLQTDGDILDLGLRAHEACDHCFKLRTELGGGLKASLASFGQREADLGGALEFVVPLFLAPGDDKSVAVKLDLEKFSEYGATDVSAEIANLSGGLGASLQEPLSRLIENALGDHLDEAVTLLEFNGPSFGLEGFELVPVVLKSDDQQGSVFAGFSANVAALNEESIPSVDEITELSGNQNIALSFQPKLVLHVLALLIGAEDVARRYTSNGSADGQGPFHVTLDTFRASGGERAPSDGTADGGFDASGPDASTVAGSDAGTSDDGSTPFGLDFTVHRFKAQGFCFSAGARATGGASIRESALSIGISDVEFTGEGVPPGVVDIANWTSAQFVKRTENLVQKSIDGENLKVPGTELGVGPVALDVQPNTFVLRGRSSVGASSEGDEEE